MAAIQHPRVSPVQVKRYDLTAEDPDKEAPQQCHHLRLDSPTTQSILKQLGLESDNVVLKLRDRTTLVPLVYLERNSRDMVLEVVPMHQNVSTTPASNYIESYLKTVRAKLNNLDKRVTRLESAAPKYQQERANKVRAEADSLSATISFLLRRLHESEPLPWQHRCNQR